MRSKKKFQIGLVFSIIGLGLFFYHMVQYIDLIERINVLSILLGGAGIDPSSIILEVFLGRTKSILPTTIRYIISILPELWTEKQYYKQ